LKKLNSKEEDKNAMLIVGKNKGRRRGGRGDPTTVASRIIYRLSKEDVDMRLEEKKICF
tara:strand:- start:437 stop:613 length:177 start_codon:yes stop_codon:yes gene_type:complete